MTVILKHFEQGSPEWLEARMNCVTMSNAKYLISKGRGKEPSVTRQTYIAEIASQIISGVLAEKVNTYDMERGNILEPFARSVYEDITGVEVETVGIGYLNDERRIAASPDGLMPNKGVEIKCQAPKNHMKTLMAMKNPKQFEAQMQGCMWVFDVDEWDYCSFCPEFEKMPMVIIPAKRDEEIVKKIEAESHKAVEEIDELVKLAGHGSFSQFVAEVCYEALDTVDLAFNKEPEIY
jgi:hypothetical protein